MVQKKKLYKVYGKRKNETFGSFYNILSTSQKGAEQQARRKYNIQIFHSFKSPKQLTP